MRGTVREYDMKTTKFTATKRFYDHRQEPVIVGEGPTARKFLPPLLDAQGNHIIRKISVETVELEESDDETTIGSVIDAQVKLNPAGTSRDDVRKDLSFGMKNKLTGRITAQIENPTKLPAVSTMRTKVTMWLLVEGRADEALPLADGSASEQDIRELYTEMTKAA